MIVQDCMTYHELVSNRKIMHVLSAIVNDFIHVYGNDEKRVLVTVDE